MKLFVMNMSYHSSAVLRKALITKKVNMFFYFSGGKQRNEYYLVINFPSERYLIKRSSAKKGYHYNESSETYNL